MPDIWMDVDAALSEVPVNIMPLINDTDFKTRETAVAYNAAGMDLVWNFVTSAGAFTQTAVTPTTAGTYDWTHQGDGMYTIEIPASGGASINNDTEGYGWFTGVATGVLPWRGPIIGFRAAAVNDALIDGGDLLDVNVTQFNGTNSTATGGRPEVNTTHAAGTAWNSGAIAAATLAADAITAAKVAADVTTELQSGLATAAALADVQTDTNDIQTRLPAALTADGLMKADTLRVGGTLQTAGDLAAMLTIIDDFLDAEIAQILGDTTTDIPAQIAALNNLSAAQVNAEVVDALNVDTYAQPGQGAPAATTTMRLMLAYLYKWARNKRDNDGTQTQFYNDDATTVDHKQSTSESGGTVTVGEMATGP